MNRELTSNSLSVVVPVYNEAAGIRQFFAALLKELQSLPVASYEVILVDDGSTDTTATELQGLARDNPEAVRVLHLTRNFGKEAALSAGLHQAKGDCVVTLDADGQHPPNMIKELLEVYGKGYDMVVGLRTQNIDEKSVKKIGNKLYYRLLKMTGISYLQPRVTDFRVMSRAVVDEFANLTERRRITRGLLDWMGFKTAYIEFEAPERLAGKATYNTRKLLYLAVDSVLSHSRKPLTISIVLGMFTTVLGLLGTVLVAFENYVLNDPLHFHFTGLALLAFLTLFMVGLLLVSQGIISLYLARIYEEVQDRPLYVINHTDSIKEKS